MTQPLQPSRMGVRAATLPPPPQPPIPPEYQMPPGSLPPGPSAKKRTGWKVAAGALATTAVFGLGFLAAQAIPRSGHDASTEAPAVVSPPASTAGDASQNERLCTAYAIARASTPSSGQSPLDVLTVSAALRIALLENPLADSDIRQAIGELAEVNEAWIVAKTGAESRGLAQLPTYERQREAAAYAQAATVCLDQ